MAANAPWSVKGIDPQTREAAKEQARRSGMTLGEWLNQRIREKAEALQASPPVPPPLASAKPSSPAPGRGADSLGALAERLDAAEQRSTLAFSGLDQSVRGVIARVESAERNQAEVRRLIEERLARVEAEGAGPRSAEALRVLEASVGKVAHRAHDAEARLADSLDELRRDIAALARRVDGLEIAPTSAGGLKVLEQRMEQLAVTLTSRVDKAKEEMAGAVDAAGARSAHTVERIGHEVLRMADSLGRRLEGVENRSADAIEQVGGEVARVISTLEGRLQRSEGAQAEALEKLGGEMARISEKLSERIAQSERRAAQAIDDVGEQVARTTERLNSRYDRASSDLAERIRQSEERTARLLEDARERIDARLADSQRRLAEQVAEVAAPVSDPARTYGERAAFVDPYAPPAPPVVYPDAAPFGQTFAPVGFTSVEPEFERADLDAASNFTPVAQPESEADFISSPPTPSAEPVATKDDEVTLYHHEPADFREPEPFPAAPAFPAGQGFPSAPAFEPPPPFQPAAQYAAAPEAATYNPAAAAAKTRDMIEQARAAARAASQPQKGAPREDRRSSKANGGLSFLGRGRKKLKNNLMVSVAVLALGAVFAGFYSLSMFKGALPPRSDLADQGLGIEYQGSEADTAPRAAMALDPRPIEGSNLPAPVLTDAPAAPNAVALYEDGAARIEAGDRGGLEPLRRAANLGVPAAQAYLGRMYEKGGAGLVRNTAEARRWYERAAQAGDRSAMHNLGYYYFEGTGGPKNLTVAAEWFRRASMLGLTDSQYNLARLYEGGLGVSQNPAEAYKWYLLASRGGSADQRAEARTAANRVGAKISDEARANAERTVQALAGQIISAQNRVSATGVNSGDVALAQRALTKLGFYRGAVDGQASPALGMAIQAYQREKDLPPSGKMDAATLQSLRPYMS